MKISSYVIIKIGNLAQKVFPLTESSSCEKQMKCNFLPNLRFYGRNDASAALGLEKKHRTIDKVLEDTLEF